MMVSRHLGAPCGSVLGRSLVLSSGLIASWRRAEILKLKELPNDGFETSRGALWLGIGTFFGFKLDYHRPPGAGPKS